MTVMDFIYALCDPLTQEVRYIGKSMRPSSRYREHILMAEKGEVRTHVYNWIRALIIRGLLPKLVIVERCEPCDSSEREKFWIRQYKKEGLRLCNCTEGGTGGSTRTGKTNSKEHVAAMRKGWRRAKELGLIAHRAYSLEERELRAEKMRNRNVSDETRQRMSESKTGRKLSFETKCKIRDKNIGRKHSETSRRKMSENKKGKFTDKMKVALGSLHERHRLLPLDKKRRNVKLTEDKVTDIRKMLNEGLSLNKIADIYRVSKRTILFIKQRKTWTNV